MDAAEAGLYVYRLFSIRIMRVLSRTTGILSVSSSAARMSLSLARCVTMKIGTALYSFRPFWMTDEMLMECAPRTPAIFESTPGLSTTWKRR